MKHYLMTCKLYDNIYLCWQIKTSNEFYVMKSFVVRNLLFHMYILIMVKHSNYEILQYKHLVFWNLFIDLFNLIKVTLLDNSNIRISNIIISYTWKWWQLDITRINSWLYLIIWNKKTKQIRQNYSWWKMISWQRFQSWY